MNARNPFELTRCLAPARVARRQAAAIAGEIDGVREGLVANDSLTERLAAALAHRAVRLGGLVAGAIDVAASLSGPLVSLHQ